MFSLALAAGLLTVSACAPSDDAVSHSSPNMVTSMEPSGADLMRTLRFTSFVSDAFLSTRPGRACRTVEEPNRIERHLSAMLPDSSFFNLRVVRLTGESTPLWVTVARGWRSGLMETATWTRVQDSVFLKRVGGVPGNPKALPASGPRKVESLAMPAAPEVRVSFLELADRAFQIADC